MLIFTDAEYPIAAPTNVQVILLDLPAKLEASLSADLPADPGKAQVLFQQRINPQLAAQISQAHQDVANAWSLGVTKIPAVVVDQRYVIYGEPDIRKALDRIAKFREQQP
jgi:integrating conjugative element protein (TIGR03757 family)